MKIGILTVPFNNNFGGLLQAFALKVVLTEMGHDVLFLNRQRNKPRSLKFRIYDLLVRLHIIQDFLSIRMSKLSVNTEEFKKKHLYPISEPYYTTQEFCHSKNLGIDYYIVGSDQVWRYDYAGDSIDDYFFNILDGIPIPRMSYAASFGTELMDYPTQKQKVVTKLLKQFKGISVREESGCDILNQYFNVPLDEVQVVLDPTFLIDTSKYKELFEGEKIEQNDYIFSYILDKSQIDEDSIVDLCDGMNCSRLDLMAQTGDISKLDVIAPVEQWLASIYYSQSVVTDSFHGTVFSIIFNRPFIVVANPKRGITRLRDLLCSLELEERLVNKIDNTSLSLINEPINWEYVNNLVQKKRYESMSFIERMLKISN